MKLDKRHLIGSVALLVASILYNVWVFTRPADGASAVSQPAALDAFATPPVAAPGAATPASVDPAQVKPLADVALDRLPQWPRDPFASLRPVVAAPVVDTAIAAPAPVEDPDPVVASILYSADRRLAMIGGRIVRVGDLIGDMKVIEIRPTEVVIESPTRGRRTLSTRAGAGGSAR